MSQIVLSLMTSGGMKKVFSKVFAEKEGLEIQIIRSDIPIKQWLVKMNDLQAYLQKFDKLILYIKNVELKHIEIQEEKDLSSFPPSKCHFIAQGHYKEGSIIQRTLKGDESYTLVIQI